MEFLLNFNVKAPAQTSTPSPKRKAPLLTTFLLYCLQYLRFSYFVSTPTYIWRPMGKFALQPGLWSRYSNFWLRASSFVESGSRTIWSTESEKNIA